MVHIIALRTSSNLELASKITSDQLTNVVIESTKSPTLSNVPVLYQDSISQPNLPPLEPPIDSAATTQSTLLNGSSLSNSVEQLRSCLSRRASSVASVTKKRVIYNDSAVVIGDSHQETITLKLIEDLADWHSTIDDDEVFSDSIEPKLPRGDMCTPYPTRRSSIPGVMYLPDWFGDDRLAREWPN